eukprot:s1702_g9.t4
MVTDCQQTAGSNPLRAAGKAAGVQLGWWRAGKKKCYVCDTHRSSASRKANTPGRRQLSLQRRPARLCAAFWRTCRAWHAVVNRKNVKDSYQSLSKHKTHAAALQATVAALRNQGRPSADQATQAAVPCVADEPVPDGSSAGRFAELVQLAENETPVAEAGGVSGVAVVPVPDANAAGDLLQYAQPPANEKRQIEARSASSPSTAAVSQTVPGISLEHPPAQTVQASPILTPSVEAAGDVRGSLNSASAPALGMRPGAQRRRRCTATATSLWGTVDAQDAACHARAGCEAGGVGHEQSPEQGLMPTTKVPTCCRYGMSAGEEIHMPFAALWFRREAAHRIVLKNSRLLAKQSDAGAPLTCACSRQFQAFRKSSWAWCWLGHARQHLDITIQEALPPSSIPGLGGRWLEDGNACPSCGSTLAGWVCGGGDDHLTSCEEALVFQGRWHGLLLDGEGRLQVDAQRCCFHIAGDFKPSHMQSATDAGVRQIRQHLLAHDKAVSSLLRRVQTFQGRLRKHRQMPLLGNSLQCTTDDLPPDFASRVKAFQRVAGRVTPGQLIQQLCAGSTDFEQRLPAIDASDLLLRPGSVVLPAAGAGDGWCVLRLDARRSRVQMARVQRTEDCARHVHAVCFQIIYNDLQWKRLDDVHGHVITMVPRFGWRHDFSLPLEKVCWRRADFLGATEDWWANKRVKSSQKPSVSQPESRVLSRCNAVLESCQTAFRLTPQDCRQLRELFPVVLVWFSNSRGQVQPLSACSCASCGSPLRSLGVRATSRLGLGRDYLFHTLLPVARCTASGCAVRRKLTLAQEGTVTPPAGALCVAFDVFGGRVVDQKLTDWLCRTFRKHFNQAALRASYADLLGTALTCQRTSCSPQLHNLV